MRQASKKKYFWDKGLFILTLVLTVLGLIAVADASAPQALQTFSDKFYLVKQQVAWAAVGILALLVTTQVPYKIWEKLALPLFGLSVILLLAVIIPGLTPRILGARRWIHLGPLTIQPSEIVKFTLVIYLAKVSAKNMRSLAFFIPLVLVFILIMLEPDLGTALIIAIIGLIQIFMSDINFFKFIGIVLVSVAGSSILILTSEYRWNRLLTFFQRTQDPLGKDYHIRQILLALGSGGFWGVGLGQSRQKYLFLPESATDSILAVIGEEVGFIGTLILVTLFGLFIYKAILIAKKAPDKFARILAIGITAWIGGQTLLNMCATIAIVPLTGVPLPFFSYGGSSLVTVLAATGILLNISRYGYSRI